MGADPLTMGLTAASGGLSVLGSISQGQDAKAWGKYQNKQAKADASATLGAARVEQRKIRDSAQQQRSSAVSGTANSGVVVGDGTAAAIESRILERGEYDAQMIYYNAQDEANRILAEGQAAKIQGNQQAQASYLQGFGSLLGAGAAAYAAYDKWKSTSKPTTPQSSALINKPTQGFGFFKTGGK